jgi:hemoglobin/transferrin/lactoferrin receptor protein
MSQVFAVVNAREATIYGGSFDLIAKISKSISFKTDFTYLKGQDNDGLPLRHIPPYYGGLHLLYENKFLSGDFYFVYNGKITNDNLAPEEQSKTYMYELDENGLPYSPSWYTLNFKMSVQPAKFISIQGGVENILNIRYRPYSSGIVSPGRNFYVAVRITIG